VLSDVRKKENRVVLGIQIPTENKKSEQAKQSPFTAFSLGLEDEAFFIYSTLIKTLCNKTGAQLVNQILVQDIDMSLSIDVSDTVKELQDLFKIFKANYITDTVIYQFFNQIFYFINAKLFNELLKRPECCTCKRGLGIKMALSQFGQVYLTDVILHNIEMKLNLIIEAANFLVMDKLTLTEDDIVTTFPTLNALQLKQILELFRPDQLAPSRVPTSIFKVIESTSYRNTSSSNMLSLYIDADLILPLTKQECDDIQKRDKKNS